MGSWINNSDLHALSKNNRLSTIEYFHMDDRIWIERRQTSTFGDAIIASMKIKANPHQMIIWSHLIDSLQDQDDDLSLPSK